MPHIDRLAPDAELWENHGWCVRARSGETEFLLWIAFYVLRGSVDGLFTVDDVRISQAVIVQGKFDDRSVMTDTPFHVSGVNWSEYLPASELTTTIDANGHGVWVMGDRRHESSPPSWHVKGRAGDCLVDLRFDAMASESWFDAFDLIDGYEALARVRGTVERHGFTHHVVGFGQHEKVHTSFPIQRTDGAGWLTLPESLRHMWHCGAGERIAFSMLANQPGERAERINGHVVVDGTSHQFERDDVTFVETGSWLDPRSGVTIPTSWSIQTKLPGGSLSLTVSAYARAYYIWDYIRGTTSLLYWMMADADVALQFDDGRCLTEQIPYVAHTNRPFLYWGDTWPTTNQVQSDEKERSE